MAEKKTLSERINSVTVRHYKNFREDVFEELTVSRATWHNWKSGKSEPNYSDGLIISTKGLSFFYAPFSARFSPFTLNLFKKQFSDKYAKNA